MLRVSSRGWAVVAMSSVVLAAIATLGVPWLNAQDRPASAGRVTHDSLDTLLRKLRLEPKRDKLRYDFRFKAKYGGEDWVLSMSAVLSQNEESLWVMAWLDELPRSASDVPRTALLRLLSDNDRLGNGKFFAYVSGNRRFVMQRVIPNNNVSAKVLHQVLDDLGSTVVQTYPHWNVANWSNKPAGEQQQPAAARTATGPRPSRRK